MRHFFLLMFFLLTGLLSAQVSLVCNDLVNYPLAPTCSDTVPPEAFLEGTYPGGYDNFRVEFDRTPPYGNGPWVLGVAGVDDIGKTYQYRVNDLVSGNKCWGNIKILAPELASSFDYTSENLTTTFNNTSVNALSYLWDFGDGAASTEINPVHTYSSPGTYTVVLTASNVCAAANDTLILSLTSGAGELSGRTGTRMFPNPSLGDFVLKLNSDRSESHHFRLTDLQGRIIRERIVDVIPGENTIYFHEPELPGGVYVINGGIFLIVSN